MASKAATDFLTKEIKASNNIVTFRLLSRQLSIHVAEAKRELELFHVAAKRTKDPVFATYVLTGAPALQPEHDTAAESRGGSAEQVSRHLIVLAGENELEESKSRFADTPSQHVYSLSPVPLKDHGLLTSVADRVRQLDMQKGQTHASQIGMLLSKEAPWPGNSDGKSKRSTTEAAKKDTPAPAKKSDQTTKPKVSSESAQPAATKDTARQGALNFGGMSKKPASESEPKNPSSDKPKQPTVAKKDEKAKTPKDKAATPQPEPPKESSKPSSPASSKASAIEPSKPTVIASKSAGGRSKRVLDSSDEDEPAPSHSKPAMKRKKSRAMDDEDDEPAPTTQRSSASLQAMMDVDDDGVVNGRSTRETTPEHVPSAREVAAAAKAAKAEASKGVDQKERGPRKRVPKGKKRVMKTRRVKNAKGYMVTEDYSSYEDVDPNDADKGDDTDVQSETDYGEEIDVDVSGKVIPTKAKPTPATSGSKAPSKRQPSEASAKPKKNKSTDTAKSGQPKLASFFGKK